MKMKKIKGFEGLYSIKANGDVISKTKEGTYSKNVCEFILPDTDDDYELEREEIEANAKLIAAAPNLLYELERARMALIVNGYTDKSSTIISIDKAINKAL